MASGSGSQASYSVAKSVVKPSGSQAPTVRLLAAWSLRGRQFRGAALGAVGPRPSLAVVAIVAVAIVAAVTIDVVVDLVAGGLQAGRVCGTRALQVFEVDDTMKGAASASVAARAPSIFVAIAISGFRAFARGWTG